MLFEPSLVSTPSRISTYSATAASWPPKAPHGPLPVAVGEDRERRRLQHPEVLAQPEPAAEPARALGVLDEREARDLDGVVQLRLLDRRVLGVLAVGLHRVRAVARRAGRRSRRRAPRRSTCSCPCATSSEPKPAWHIIPFVPAGSRSGNAGRSARNITSTSRSCVSQPPTTGDGPGAVRHRSLGRVEAEEPVEAVVHRQVGVDQALQRVGARREGHRVGRVDRRAPLRIRARRVEVERRRA